jgi:sugar/nucleoside kinase (ribokinase family)
VGAAALSTGGAVSNVGLALHRLGIGTQLMGKIGRDLFGQAIAQVVASFDPHLTAGMIVDDAAVSSYAVVINPPGVDRVFLHCPGANDTFGACNIEAPDALSGIRSWEETQARVAGGWPQHCLHLDAPGWRFDELHGLWARLS